MLILNRRQWIHAIAAVPIASPLGALLGKVPNTRISLAAYSLRNELQAGKIDLFQFIDWCSELDLGGVELTSYYFRSNFDSAYLRQLKNHAHRRGLTISGTAIRNNFCLPPGDERDRELERVSRWLQHASVLGAPVMRVFAGDPPDGGLSRAIDWVADSIKSLLDPASQNGVILALENHGAFTSRAEHLLAIREAIGEHPWFGFNLDTGNFRESPYQAIRQVAPYAVNVQLKVEILDSRGQKVPADLPRIADILKEADYRGWVALEYEGERAPRQEIPHYVQVLQSLFEGR